MWHVRAEDRDDRGASRSSGDTYADRLDPDWMDTCCTRWFVRLWSITIMEQYSNACFGKTTSERRIAVFYVRSLKKLVMLTLGPLLMDHLIEIVCAKSTATLMCAAMSD